jgi:hypothetical protein
MFKQGHSEITSGQSVLRAASSCTHAPPPRHARPRRPGRFASRGRTVQGCAFLRPHATRNALRSAPRHAPTPVRAGLTKRAPCRTASPSAVPPPMCVVPRPHLRRPSSRARASPIKVSHPLTSRARVPLSPPYPQSCTFSTTTELLLHVHLSLSKHPRASPSFPSSYTCRLLPRPSRGFAGAAAPAAAATLRRQVDSLEPPPPVFSPKIDL